MSSPGNKRKPAFRKGGSADNPDRIADKKDTMKRSKATINRLNMYRGGAPVRNKKGEIVGGTLMSRDKSGDKPMGTSARIAPNRKWFGNTRVVTPQALDKFRDELGAKVSTGPLGPPPPWAPQQIVVCVCGGVCACGAAAARR